MWLRSYDGTSITAIGACDVKVRYDDRIEVIPFVVIKNGGLPLLRRNFLKMFKIKICKLNYCAPMPIARQIIYNFGSLIDGSLGEFEVVRQF